MAADEGTKIDIKELLQGIVKKVEALDKKVDAEVAARRNLSESATQTLTDYGKAIEGIQQALFAALSLHIDLVGPRRKDSDPEVAAEATRHANFAMKAQANAAPSLFEQLYGISAESGETLPGREAGVALVEPA
ncbi:MAG: hypothetical protein DI630_00670 [Gordonia sp. (in: high G+C Gram-positive bacteria)]|nr:MAG: hypothetical protein DI630_00670 [Gordonia sp. (in: high G+C Gram-positive bacteria)]